MKLTRRVMMSLPATAVALAATRAYADTLPITIGAGPATDDAPGFAGLEKGIFARHGLDAKVVMYQSGVDMVNGLLNGAQQVNLMGSIPFLTGVARGFPLVLIAHLHGNPLRDYYADNVSVVASAKAGIKAGDLAGLKGKKLGLPRGSGAEGYLFGLLKEAGLGAGDVTLVNINAPDLVNALQQNDIDAASIWEPWGSTLVDKVAGAVRVQAGGCRGCYDPGTILTSKATIATKAETLRRFMVAFAEAQQWCRKNSDEAASINMHWIPGVELKTMQSAIHSSNLDCRMSKYTVSMYKEKEIPFLANVAHIDKNLDPAPAIDTQFYLYAARTAPQFFSDLPPIPTELQVG